MQRRLLSSLCILMGLLSEYCFGLTLTGQVVDTQAQPIQGAEVVVCERYSVGKHCRFANVISPVVKTDAQGRFVFELDPALSENVSRQRDIFVVARKAGLACAWEWLNASLNTWARRDFPLVLEPAGELGGRVVDAKGIPVKGAEVQELPLTYSGFRGSNDTSRVPGPKAWFSVTTDTQGRFRFDQLSVNANAWLRVRAPGSQNCYDMYAGSHLGFWIGQSEACLRLPGVGTIVGQVRDDRGRPAPGVDLKFFPNQTFMDMVYVDMVYKDRMTCSDAQGFFSFDAIPQGSHWIEVCGHDKDPDLWVGKRVAVSVKAGQTSKRAVVRVTKGGTFHVTARHARTGHPLEGMEIGVSNRILGYRTKITDTQGRARIRALPGSYLISVGGDRINLRRTMKAVRSGQTVQVKALVDSAPKITGRVVDTQNQPVAHALVSVDSGGNVVTDADGRFSAYCSRNRSVDAIWIMARDREHDRAVLRHVTDLSTPVTLKLKPAYRLIGQVTDPQGRPVCAARVNLDSKASDGNPRMDERVLTDRQGRFTLKAIPPKQPGFDYRLYINAAGYGPANSKRIEAQGLGGETLDIGTFALVPATESVSGRVVNAQGVPVPGARVRVNSVGGVVPQHFVLTATDEHGRFRLPHLCKGAIKIWTPGGNKHRNEGTLTLQVPAEDVKVVLGKDLFHDEK
ncbi:MAG: carboxypeptidase regulatory-like domain-containing protein [Phycisphaeraceae bacterium]|nr:carboxypeptidase regulatory-like domain-containing protein [Phycisphaeraceae bacterium]